MHLFEEGGRCRVYDHNSMKSALGDAQTSSNFVTLGSAVNVCVGGGGTLLTFCLLCLSIPMQGADTQCVD